MFVPRVSGLHSFIADPTVSWLLVISEDLTVCIVPVLSLVVSFVKHAETSAK
jgi:hypothetical protein